MALGLDTKAQMSAPSTANPVTLDYTCGASAKLLVVLAIVEVNSPIPGSSITYNGVAKTGSSSAVVGSAECASRLYYWVNPPTGSAYTISLVNPDALNIRLMAVSLTGTGAQLFGAYQYNFTSSDAPSCTINSVPAGGACVAVLGHGYKAPPTARSHTTIYENDEGAYSSNGQYGLIASLGNVTMSWTLGGSDDVAMLMAAFEEVSGTLSISELENVAISEDKSVSIAAQPALSPAKIETVAIGEDFTVSVQEPVVEPLSVSTPAEALAIGDVPTVAVAAQPALAITPIQPIAVADVPTVGAITAAALTPSAIQAVAISEAKTVEVSAQPALSIGKAEAVSASDVPTVGAITGAGLEIGKIESVGIADVPTVGAITAVTLEPSVAEAILIGEVPGVEISSQPTLAPSITEDIAITEARGLAIGEPQVETLNIPAIVEAVAISEVKAVSVSSQPTLALSIAESVTIADVPTVNASQIVLEISKPEAVSVVDAPILQLTEQLARSIAVSDGIAISEARALIIGVIQPLTIPSQTDNIQLSEAVALSLGIEPDLAPLLAESVTISELAAIQIEGGGGEEFYIEYRRRRR